MCTSALQSGIKRQKILKTLRNRGELKRELEHDKFSHSQNNLEVETGMQLGSTPIQTSPRKIMKQAEEDAKTQNTVL